MGRYTKHFLAVLYLFQVYVIFGGHLAETYRHFMATMSPSATSAREFVANAVLKKEVPAASPTGERMHQAMDILHAPAALALVLKDAYIIHPHDDGDGPEEKDKPRGSRRRKKWRAPPNLYRDIKSLTPQRNRETSRCAAGLRLLRFDPKQS